MSVSSLPSSSSLHRSPTIHPPSLFPANTAIRATTARPFSDESTVGEAAALSVAARLPPPISR
ncbi:vegetative cell wall protein gp1-like [Iris pallida]|uniref:Vegetative cell wall protein gp1-like n=1 Tax=Iris pallida TaxID=29817 RepID=A0AAX6E7Y6_IRIPA|nr:vegetative cell wall protein gp1-like [Iris pallida]